ncbi:MAG: molybdopterin-synthase adenylyltransferase MoeB [Pseudomonadota bacterium]
MPLTDTQLDRYARHIILKEVGGQGQQKLLNAKVLLIGAGGIGAPAALYLAAAGVGTLGIVDDDHVDLSNLQRQIMHDTDKIGDAKTDSAAAAVARLNPDVTVAPHPVRLTPDNAAVLIAPYDIVLDGSDSFETRFAVNAAAAATRTPLVSAAVGRFEGQVATFKPFAAGDGAPLPCYQCFVPDAPPDAETCEAVGILGAVAGVVGTLAAVEVLKEILGLGDSLAGRVLIYDALRTETRTVGLPPDPNCPVCGGGG